MKVLTIAGLLGLCFLSAAGAQEGKVELTAVKYAGLKDAVVQQRG